MMGQIYSSAEQVYVWIAEADASINKQIERLRDFSATNVSNPREYRKAYHRYVERNITEDSLAYLLGHPYWLRMWIVQEIVLARMLVILCGDCSFDLYWLQWLARFSKLTSAWVTFGGKMLTVLLDYRTGFHSRSLQWLLSNFGKQ